jgi:GNAT superfamily N-acetyltransferase
MRAVSQRTGIVLTDGRLVQIRPIESADADRLVRFHESLSPETTRSRFFVLHPHLSEKEVARFTTVDHHGREALVALTGNEIVGVARFDRCGDSQDAEVAFVVADALQGFGVGSLLLEHLAARARAEGLERFVAETLMENRRMLRVFAGSGLATTQSWDCGVVHLVMSLCAGGATRRSADGHALLGPSSLLATGPRGR